MAHGVDGPCVFDDEEGNPLPLADVAEVDTTNKDGKRIDNKKYNIELSLVTRGFLVVGDVEEEFLEPHGAIISHYGQLKQTTRPLCTKGRSRGTLLFRLIRS